ncbi:MAG: glutathione peroxidase [Coraliomargaritaceae bacterium]
MRNLLTSAFMILSLLSCSFSENADSDSDSVYSIRANTIAGDTIELSKYEGKVLIIVNVASRCGLTSQYTQLQELYDKYAEDGLEILGFPCNQFGKQEPGTSEEIENFCRLNYGVRFQMMEKIMVNGNEQHPLFARLTDRKLAPGGSGKIGWNFEKFIIGRNGKPLARFPGRTKPDSQEFVAVLRAALEAE